MAGGWEEEPDTQASPCPLGFICIQGGGKWGLESGSAFQQSYIVLYIVG